MNGSTMHIALLIRSDRVMNLVLLLEEVIQTISVLLSLSVCLKKILIRGGIGNTWAHYFYMGTQNG